VTAGTRRPRNPPGARAEIAATAATLAYNVAISQATSGISYVMANADFRTGTSALGLGEFEAELASAPPGDGGVGGQAGVAEDG
jgi:hypothetical protein